MRFCTIADVFELPAARVLAQQVQAHHGTCLSVLLSGRPPASPDEPFVSLRPQELGVRELDLLMSAHDREDNVQLLRPHLLHALLHQGDGPLVYLDAGHDLLAPLEPVSDLLRRHPVVLCPRVLDDLPEDGREPSTRDLRVHGRITTGFVAVAPGEAAERFLDWWAERAGQLAPLVSGRRSGGNPERGKRLLRRVLEPAPAVFSEVVQLSDPGCEVSAWNLHERPLARVDGAITAGGAGLRSLVLDGYSPQQPHLMGPRATRVTPASEPLLAGLLSDYAERLLAAGWSDLSRRGDIGRRLADGLPFDDRLEQLYAEALAEGQDFGDILAPHGTRAFRAWMMETRGPGAAAGISRYLYRVYRDRADLPTVYPDLDGGDGPEFAAWCWVFGQTEMGIPRAFLPPRPEHVPAPEEPEVAVEVAGYFTGTLGLGEAARLYVSALRAAGVPVRTTTVDPQLPVDRRLLTDDGYGRLEFTGLAEGATAAANLICVNAEELPRFASDAGEAFFADRANVGVWAWETDAIPARWDGSFKYLDEIWVYSRYVAENLARVSPIPVVPVPPPITAPETGSEPDLGLPDGFRFMFMFDFFSTVKRKNPVAVVEAFTRAFAPGEGPHLVIKTIHGDHRRQEFERLAYAAGDRPDVFIVDRSLSVPEKNGLLASCDCYVSLHRSEGYGLPLAECMAMGKPVVATAFSGNLDFMTAGNSYLVDYTLTPVGGDVEIYPAEGVWAEPDVEQAAAQLRAVWTDQDAARRRGRRAAGDIAEQLSPARVGALARSRLELLAQTRAADDRKTGALAELDRILARDGDPGRKGPLGLRSVARQVLFRMLRPYTAQGRAVDETVARTLHELQAEIEAQRAEIARLRPPDPQ